MQGKYEKQCLEKGEYVVGVDEVGRGCIAGPVYAAAVELDYEKLFALDPKVLKLIRDSKTLSAKQRAYIQPVILEIAVQVKVAVADVDEIDRLNILQASFVAMHRCLLQGEFEGQLILVDGNKPLPDYKGRQETVVGGDGKVYAIAAASILAKQVRDKYMSTMSEKYPVYGFERHMGYGTKFHLQMLQLHGPCDIHRKSFAPVAKSIESRKKMEA